MSRIAEHWVAHTRGGDRGLVERERAPWLWERLRAAIPDVLSCVLLPEHLHVEAPPGRGERLRRVLTGYTRRFGVRFDLLDPEPANSAAIATRQIRYGFFNPRRDGHVDDPWRWPWSTLRDLAGACHPIWTDLPTLAARLGMPPAQLLPHVTTTADYAAAPLTASPPLTARLDAICSAVASALRHDDATVPRHTTGRRLVIQASYEIGMPKPARLAAQLDCSIRTVHRLRHPRHPALDAVLRCLADPRLHAGPSWR